MKKLIILAAALAAIAVLTPSTANAQAYPFESSVVETGDLGADAVYQRYYTPGKPDMSRGCSTACGLAGVNCSSFNGQEYCRLTWGAKGVGGYRGYSEDIGNYGADYGTVFYSVFDFQRNTGTGAHQGYYAWTSGPVNNGAQSTWNGAGANCVGTAATACLGNANLANAKNVTGVPSSSGATGNTLNKIGGLSPIPVPRAVSGAPSGIFRISWDAATSVGGQAGIAATGYDIYVSKAANCATPPTDASVWTFVKTVAGTTTDVTEAEAGLTPGEAAGVTFALKIRFPSTSDGDVIVTRYLSANGQCFLNGGLSANIYELAAKYVGKTNVEVTWKTSLEDGVRGFYVSRSTTQNGPYTRVSDLIPAKGEASAYSFIDAVQAPGAAIKATGLWYKVETIDIDDNAVEYGPTKAQMPNQGSNIIKQRTAKPQR